MVQHSYQELNINKWSRTGVKLQKSIREVSKGECVRFNFVFSKLIS